MIATNGQGLVAGQTVCDRPNKGGTAWSLACGRTLYFSVATTGQRGQGWVTGWLFAASIADGDPCGQDGFVRVRLAASVG